MRHVFLVYPVGTSQMVSQVHPVQIHLPADMARFLEILRIRLVDEFVMSCSIAGVGEDLTTDQALSAPGRQLYHPRVAIALGRRT